MEARSGRTPRVWRAALSAACALAWLLVDASSVRLAAQPPVGFCAENENEVTFAAGTIHQYDFPPNVSLRIALGGASGGTATSPGSSAPGGAGAILEGVLYSPIAAGESLAILVGEAGEDGMFAGGGGGATYIARGVGAAAFSLAGNLVVTAGGGGGGAITDFAPDEGLGTRTFHGGGDGGTNAGTSGAGLGGGGGSGDTGGGLKLAPAPISTLTGPPASPATEVREAAGTQATVAAPPRRMAAGARRMAVSVEPGEALEAAVDLAAAGAAVY